MHVLTHSPDMGMFTVPLRGISSSGHQDCSWSSFQFEDILTLGGGGLSGASKRKEKKRLQAHPLATVNVINTSL